jgi:hypothetical protein
VLLLLGKEVRQAGKDWLSCFCCIVCSLDVSSNATAPAVTAKVASVSLTSCWPEYSQLFNVKFTNSRGPLRTGDKQQGISVLSRRWLYLLLVICDW